MISMIDDIIGLNMNISFLYEKEVFMSKFERIKLNNTHKQIQL